jgi:bleomycin hydrolase
MQSYDRRFSNEIEPQLVSTDQKNSGRCWIFAVLNVARHKTICKYELENDFEFSQCYLSFWDKLEKCNYTLNEIIKNRHLPNFLGNEYIRSLLSCPVTDGGHWVTCKNLIKKYGLVPQSVFDESFNSSNTEEMNYILEHKVRQFAQELYRTKSENECYQKKQEMVATIYHIMSKLFGSPKLPDSKFDWTYCIDQEKDLLEMIERQKKRRKTSRYENLELKKKVKTTALEYYRNYVPFDCDEMIQVNHDPRNPYYKCYTNEKPNMVYDGERTLYLNLQIDDLIAMTKRSVLDNTPVVFMCDVGKHMNVFEGILDTKCFNYQSVFNTTFQAMSKADRINFRESAATHAMVITGVDLDDSGEPVKWQVENSWGQVLGDFIMSTDWFRDYVFEVIVEEKYLEPKHRKIYHQERQRPAFLPFTDPMV